MEQPLNGIEIEEILAGLLTVVIPFIAAYVRQFLKANADNKHVQTLTALARVAVYAAEELEHKAAKVDEKVPGSAKLEKAATDLAVLARKAGIKLTEAQAKALIEGTLHAERPYMEAPDLEAVFEDGPPAGQPELPPLPSDPELEELVERLREPDADDAAGSRPV